MNVPVHHFLYLGAFLFSAGLVVVISKRNTILVLLGLELMLNASNLNLVAFNRLHPGTLQGQMFAIFVIVVAVCEAAVGLAIVLRIYQEFQTSVPDDVNELNL